MNDETLTLLEVPRIYTSFADFECEEMQRRGLDAWPAPVPEPTLTPTETPNPMPMPAKSMAMVKTAVRPVLRPATRVTPSSLRAEGIIETGCAQGTSVLFVRTRVKIHVLHATWLPDRQLDDYAVNLAVNWIESHGMPSCEVARNLSVSEPTLRKALADAGYERLTPSQSAQRVRARGRRGRLVRVTPAALEVRS